MKRPEAIFFDLDDTLVDDQASVLRSLALALDVVRPDLPRFNDSLAVETYLRVSSSTWNTGTVNGGTAWQFSTVGDGSQRQRARSQRQPDGVSSG